MVKRESDVSLDDTAMLPSSPGAVEYPTLAVKPTSEPQRGSDVDEDLLASLGPGSFVSHFLLAQKLGEGGMGVVFLAKDRRLKRDVAIKLLRVADAQASNPTQAQQRMLREAQAMAMLSHSNLVTIYEVGTFAKSVFLAMEYVTGQPLDSWLDSLPPLSDIFDVFQQAGKALGAVHDAGLVHRDFKPANVIVTADGTAKVLDLGIARKLTPGGAPGDDVDPLHSLSHSGLARVTKTRDGGPRRLTNDRDAFDSQLTHDGAIVGTPAYMSPEQLLGGTVGPAADQFSFAIALFEALTGERPFAGNDALAIMTNIVSGARQPWPENSELPVQFREAVDRALSGDPDQRFPSMREFLEACEQALGLRGQIRFLTSRWLSNDKHTDYLLPEGKLLGEGRALLARPPSTFPDDQREFLLRSWQLARKKQVQRRTLLGGLGLVTLGLVPTAWLLERRSHQLEQATRAELTAEIAALREKVESAVTGAEESIRLMFAQRAVWTKHLVRLALAGDRQAGGERAGAELLEPVQRLNDFFRPVVERSPAISSLMLASNGLEYLIFDDPDAAELTPPYRFYNRVVNRARFPEVAFQVFWPPRGPQTPRTSWLGPGDSDSRGQPWHGYHPERRPWFKNAVGHPGERVHWTKPYLFFVTKDAGITGSMAWHHEGQSYVLGVDFMLTHVSTITTGLTNSKFLALITTRDGQLVGLPDGVRFGSEAKVREFFVHHDAAQRAQKATLKRADVAAELPTADSLGIATVSAALTRAKTDRAPVFSFKLDGQTYWAGQSNVGSKDLDLTIFVVERGNA